MATKQEVRDHRALLEKTRYQQRKRDNIEYLGGACHDCGDNHHHDSAYDIHHTDPSVKTKDGYRLTLATDRDELDTCHVLCAICHRTRHATDDLTGRKYRRANPR